MDDYREVNRANWDERVPAHVGSADYAVSRFVSDPSFISDVVRFDVPLLGDIAGLRGVHLQCHIGTDTVSLARLGASMTGLDFSAPAVSAARKLASSSGVSAAFVQADGEWRLTDGSSRVPCSYTLQAVKGDLVDLQRPAATWMALNDGEASFLPSWPGQASGTTVSIGLYLPDLSEEGIDHYAVAGKDPQGNEFDID
jgi:hypothetical protein